MAPEHTEELCFSNFPLSCLVYEHWKGWRRLWGIPWENEMIWIKETKKTTGGRVGGGDGELAAPPKPLCTERLPPKINEEKNYMKIKCARASWRIILVSLPTAIWLLWFSRWFRKVILFNAAPRPPPRLVVKPPGSLVYLIQHYQYVN